MSSGVTVPDPRPIEATSGSSRSSGTPMSSAVLMTFLGFTSRVSCWKTELSELSGLRDGIAPGSCRSRS